MIYLALICVAWLPACHAQPAASTVSTPGLQVQTGAERMEIYLGYLKGKKVGVFANPTSIVGNSHLVDTLLKKGVNVVKIFGPEHGFRGNASAGEHVEDGKDPTTGVPVVSLYGNHRKPTEADLKNIDVLIFDIQDIGVRFYTYISSLEYFVEAALENHKPLLILDRPNPNGFYVDGPILDKKFKSFIGMQAVPVVHGMTVGEYAMMLAGENLLSAEANTVNAYNISTTPNADTPFHMMVIKCKNYDHNTFYHLPVAPSPNIPDMQSLYMYPSTCFFEGTVMSEGRGTPHPFLIFGHPSLPKNLYPFVPKPNEGAKSSKCYYQQCYGWNEYGTVAEVLVKTNGSIRLSYLLDAYKLFQGKDSFFLKNNFLHRLAGNDILMKQIKDNKTEAEIKASWQPGLQAFKQVRRKYLLYKDFED